MIKSDLLIHSVRVLSQSGIDRDGNKTTTETVINHVRVEYYNAVTQGTAGAQAADTMTLFLDPALAEYQTTTGGSAAAVIPAEGDAVVFEGKQYEVKKVTPRYTRQSAVIHHYEVDLT